MSKQEETQNGVRDANREIRRVLADELPSIDFSFGDDDPPARVRGIITAALPPSSGGAAKRVMKRLGIKATDGLPMSPYDCAYNTQIIGVRGAFVGSDRQETARQSRERRGPERRGPERDFGPSR